MNFLALLVSVVLAQSPLDAPELSGAVPAAKALEKSCAAGDAASCWLSGKAPSPLKAAVLQGPTAKDATRLSLWSPVPLQWSFVDLTRRRRVVADRFERHVLDEGSDELVEYRFTKLKRGHEYRALAFDGEGRFVDGRAFRVLAPKGKTFRFAVASCLDDRYDDEQRKMWPQLAADKLDFLLLLGDNVYGDRNRAGLPQEADREQLIRRQREGREKFLLYRQETLVPTFAVWDDHDYGMGDGDSTFAHRFAARDVHWAFFASGPSPVADGITSGPGVSQSFDVAGHRFVLADGRMFRAPQTVWGEGQTEWLLARLKEAKGLAFLANGHQFFGAYHRFESFERYAPDALRNFVAAAARLKTPVVLLSGDRHLVELQELAPGDGLGYRTYELTASAIHAKTYPDAWKDTKNPRQLEGMSGAVNYALVDVGPKELRFRARGIDGATFFDRALPRPRSSMARP